jgi:hypothetical protein
MKLTIVLDGEKRDFYAHGLTAGASWTAFDLLDEIAARTESGSLYDKEHRETLLRFIVELFGHQFTEQEFLEGYRDSFYNAAPDMLRSVIAGITAKVQSFPNVPAGAAEEASAPGN